MMEDIRQKIHEDTHILCQLTPRSQTLTQSMRDSLHLVNSSTIIYFGEWSDDGFEFVAKRHLLEDEMVQTISTETSHSMIRVMIEMYHDVIRSALENYQETGHYIYISPQHFDLFCQVYKRLYLERQDKLNSHLERFKSGVKRIVDTERFAESLQEDLSKKSPELVEKQQKLEDVAD